VTLRSEGSGFDIKRTLSHVKTGFPSPTGLAGGRGTEIAQKAIGTVATTLIGTFLGKPVLGSAKRKRH